MSDEIIISVEKLGKRNSIRHRQGQVKNYSFFSAFLLRTQRADWRAIGLSKRLSTDKAVKPVNAIGMSKAMMEKRRLQSKHSRQTLIKNTDAFDFNLSAIRTNPRTQSLV